MIPPSKSTTETVEVNLGKRERCNIVLDLARLSQSSGEEPMDALAQLIAQHRAQNPDETVKFIPGKNTFLPNSELELPEMPDDLSVMTPDTCFQGRESLVSMESRVGTRQNAWENLSAVTPDARMHIQSSDLVKDFFLPDTAATPAAALNAEQLSATSNDRNPQSIQQEKEEDELCPMVNLTAKLERITGESISPLNENFRISSRDWVKDFEAEQSAGMGTVQRSVFMNLSGAPDSYEEYQMPIQSSGNSQQPIIPIPLSNSNIMHNLPTITDSPTASATKSNISPSSPTTSKKKRTIDVTRAIEPNDDDVLFGRGGFTNTHRGNIRFRKKALELRPWYESSTKEEKFHISELLLESVKSEGHRVLEKGKEDGMWHEVIGNRARRKASQAFRDLAPDLASKKTKKKKNATPKATPKTQGGKKRAAVSSNDVETPASKKKRGRPSGSKH